MDTDAHVFFNDPHDEEEAFQACIPLKEKKNGRLYFILSNIFTIGFISYISFLFPYVRASIRKTRTVLEDADTVLLRSRDQDWFLVPVKTVAFEEPEYSIPATKNAAELSRVVRQKFFEFQCRRYIFDRSYGKFLPTEPDIREILEADSTKSRAGLDPLTHQRRLLHFGANVLDVPVKKNVGFYLKQIIKPIYLFQVIGIVLFSVQGYWKTVLATCIVCLFSIFITTKARSKDIKYMKQLIKTEPEIRVIRGGKNYVAGSANMVPGDIIEITGRFTLPCDVVLLNGAVEVDESTLTGDTLLIQKEPFDLKQLGRLDLERSVQPHILFSGSKVVQIKSGPNQKVLGVVFRTGFLTSKGSVVRAALFSRLKHDKLYSEFWTFTLVMLPLVVLGLAFQAYQVVKHFSPYSWGVWLDALDIFGLLMPPVWPAVFALCVSNTARRLKKREAKDNQTPIVSVQPSQITSWATVDCVCLDKTGTLTEDLIDIHAVANVVPGSNPVRVEMTLVSRGFKIKNPDLLAVMSLCHSLKLTRGQMVGDPLEVALFKHSGYVMVEQDGNLFLARPIHRITGLKSFQVAHSFPFSAEKRRMTVLARVVDEGYGQQASDTSDPTTLRALAKGSPAAIAALCKPETLPPNFTQLVEQYLVGGQRLIACARKTVHLTADQQQHVSSLTRAEIEQGMEFVGFLVLENPLRPDTQSTVKTMQEANIRTVMVTGDSGYTAVAVGAECGILDAKAKVLMAKLVKDPMSEKISVQWTRISPHTNLDPGESEHPTELAMTGAAFTVLRNVQSAQQLIQFRKLLVKCNIFAEFAPQQKADLVQELQKIDYTVGMMGDGSNDSKALAAADASVTLSDAATSSVAPFICDQDITCVVKILREGRAALASTVDVLKFLTLYLWVFFTANIQLFHQCGAKFSDAQIVWMTFFSVFFIAVSMPKTRPYFRLTAHRHTTSLVNRRTLASLFSHMLIHVGLLIAVYRRYTSGNAGECSEYWQSAVQRLLFVYANFQFIASIMASNSAKPFRSGIYTNWLLSFFVLIILSLDIFVMYGEVEVTSDIFGFSPVGHPLNTELFYKGFLLPLAFANIFLPQVVERLLRSWSDTRDKNKDLAFSTLLYERIMANLKMVQKYTPS